MGSDPIHLSYRDAGVDIDRGNELVRRIAPLAKSTHREGVMQGIGGFGALFELPLDRYRHPVLVSGTDGVGTKLKLAISLGRYDTVGIDLVAMCVNDVLVLGAEPLFFLDYYAVGELDEAIGEQVISGIAEGCRQARAALVGGETAEMPGMYRDADFDLAGFCVGIVEKDRIIDGRKVAPGHALIALGSSGAHSNGFSLIRRVLERDHASATRMIEGRSLTEALIAPTRIYVSSILALLDAIPVDALAHITGGGIVENLPRVLPAGLHARIDTASWVRPPVFEWLQSTGDIEEPEMWRTFNCGVGMIVCVSSADRDPALQILREHGESAWVIGEILGGDGGVELV